MTFYQNTLSEFDPSKYMAARGHGQFPLCTYLMWAIKGHFDPLVYIILMSSNDDMIVEKSSEAFQQ